MSDDEIKRLRDRCDHLERFKEYVHGRLDAAGVPADPESPHKAEGCRIGGRLDLVLARWGEAKIAIQAPEEIAIHRQEVRKRIERERSAE